VAVRSNNWYSYTIIKIKWQKYKCHIFKGIFFCVFALKSQEASINLDQVDKWKLTRNFKQVYENTLCIFSNFTTFEANIIGFYETLTWYLLNFNLWDIHSDWSITDS